MSSLEQFHLYITVDERKTFFDGNDLKININNPMTQLNNFPFNIRSSSSFYNEIDLPSNEDIQKTFIDFNDKQIIYWINYFPSGIYEYVCLVLLFNEHSFEHGSFFRIPQSFSFLPIIKYSYLKQLYLIDTWIEMTMNNCYSILKRVDMQYGPVKQVICNFTRNRT
ncbi:unnamed protein product [Rotaria socialis]